MSVSFSARTRMWPGLLLGLALFSLGVVAGGGAAFVVIGRRLAAAQEQPESLVPRMVDRMAHRYHLDEVQTARLESTIRRRQQQLSAIRRRSLNEAAPELDQLQEEISRILGPGQAPDFQHRFGELRRRLGPGLRRR